MTTIIPNQTFKHGTETYEEGQSYEVSAEEAYYFKMCGWVGERTEPTGEPVTLEVHDSTTSHGAPEVK
jgi:hypothetical protein